MTYIILASNSSRQVAAVGTSTGHTFSNERNAERMRRRLERAHPTVDYLVLPIEGANV